MNKSILRLFVWATLFTVLLSGCAGLTGRLLTVRNQMCEFDDFVNVQISNGVEVELYTPVLLEADIYLLMDAPPTLRFQNSDGFVARYVFVQNINSPDSLTPLDSEEFSIDFQFVPSEDKLLLSGVSSSDIPEVLSEVALLSVANSAEIAEQACHGRFNIFSRSVALELDHQTLSLLPPQESIVSWLGPPSLQDDDQRSLDYSFELKGAPVNPTVARFTANYDPTGERPVDIEMYFSHYHASIDVPAAQMKMKLYD